MTITAHVGETRNGQPLCELRDGDKVLAKLYANGDATKIRIVLPELVGYRQTVIKPDDHLLEFTRKT